MRISLKAKLGLLLGSFLLLITIIILSTFWVNSSQKAFALIINIAGRQRMLTQKMTKEVLGIARELESIDKSRKIVNQLIETRNHLARTIGAQKSFDLNHFTAGFIPAKAARAIANKFTEGTPIMLKQTSLKYRNVKNKPDAFEEKALNLFESDKSLEEYSEKVVENGVSYSRYMKRLLVKKACLKCHSSRTKAPEYVRNNYPGDKAFGYKEGDVRGAISVKVPIYGTKVNYRATLKQTSGLFDKTLNALMDGGETMGTSGSDVTIPRATNAEIINRLAIGKKLWEQFRASMEVMARPGINVDSEDFRKALGFIESNSGKLLKEMNNVTVLYQKEADKKVSLLEQIQIIAFIITIAVMMSAFWIVGRIVLHPISHMVEHLRRIATGDMTSELKVASRDEIGDVSDAVNSMTENLRGMLKEIKNSSNSVAAASEEISSATEQLAAGMDNQARQATEVASAMEEMASSVQSTYTNSQKSLEVSRNTSDTAVDGGEIVSKTMSSMASIEHTVGNSAEKIKELGDRSKEIGKIVDVIKEIAAQTNLLALNAAIEANRAGEHGRGFEVVAEEIRKLAEKSADSTLQITEIVEEIQSETSFAVESMTTATKEVETGTKFSHDTGDALEKIIKQVKETGDSINLVVDASKQQAAVSDEVATSVESISVITRETAASSEEIAQTSQELARLGDNLLRLTEKFKI